MLFRFSRVHLAKAFPGRQSSGLCVVDVQFAAAVLARIRRPEFNARTTVRALDQLPADDDRDPDLLSGLCGRLAPLEYQELLLTLEEEARRKILLKTRRLRRGLTHQLDRAPSPQPHCESRSATPKSLAPSGKRLGLPLRCKILRPSAGESEDPRSLLTPPN